LTLSPARSSPVNFRPASCGRFKPLLAEHRDTALRAFNETLEV
jgi:hypothetical protein